MGDRSNIVVENSNGNRVYLYGHWMGEGAIGHAAHGLRSGRVGDAQYLASVIFCSMVKGDEDGEIGFGISASIGDNGYPIIVTGEAIPTGDVWLEEENGTVLTEKVTGAIFAKLAEDDLDYNQLLRALPRAEGI